MSRGKSTSKFKMTSFDDLIGGTDKDAGVEKIIDAKLGDLFPFQNHPFRVLDDEKMEETTESIKQYGVLVPGIVRQREAMKL